MAAEALLWAGLASFATSGWCWLAGRDYSHLAGQLRKYEQLRSLKGVQSTPPQMPCLLASVNKVDHARGGHAHCCAADLKKQQVLPRLIAVRGRVSSRHPLAGELSGQRAAIVEVKTLPGCW
jgi:hypothetical protein